MQLQQVDPLHAESAQAHLGLLAQELRAAERVPLVRAGAHLTGFGGDDQVVGIRVERFADQLLADIGPVRIRSIDQGDAEIYRPAQHADRFIMVLRRTPDTGAGDAHGAVAEADDRQVAADAEGSALPRRMLHSGGNGHGVCSIAAPLAARTFSLQYGAWPPAG